MTGPGGALTIRPARPADAPRLAALLAAGSWRGSEDAGDVPAYRSALDEIAATPGNDVLVAELDGQVVGVCQLITFRHLQERGGRCAEIESVHVDERVRVLGHRRRPGGGGRRAGRGRPAATGSS